METNMEEPKVNKTEAIAKIVEMGAQAYSEVFNQLLSKNLSFYEFREEIIKRLVNARWMITHPEDFITTNCTDPADYHNANYAHTWVMHVSNGEFDPKDQYQIGDAYAIDWQQAWLAENNCECQTSSACAWKAEFRSRIDKIVNEVVNCPDVRIYAMTHFHVF